MEPQKPQKTRLPGQPLIVGPPVVYLTSLSGVPRSWRVPETHFLRGERVRLGRSPVADSESGRVNDWVIDVESVSRFHAVLERTAQGWTCRDDGSSGGTFVNDERLTGPRLLSPNDKVGFGPEAKFMCGGEDTAHVQLVAELPAPIARLDTAPTTNARAQIRVRALFVTLEKALRFLVGCELALLRTHAHQDATLRTELTRVLAGREFGVMEPARKLTMGTWRALAMKLASLLPTGPHAPQLVHAARGILKETQELAEAVQLRNVLAHADDPPDSELSAAMPELRALAERLIVALAPLAATRVVSVVESENLVRGYQYGIYVFVGDRPARLETWTTNAKLLPRWCYLIDPQAEPLLLAPMVGAITVGGDSADILVASRLALGPQDGLIELGSGSTKLELPIPWFDEIASLYESVSTSAKR